MSKVPVLQSVRAAIEFRRIHWRAVAGVLGAVALGGAMESGGEIAGDRLAQLLGNAIYVPTTIIAYVALMRLAFLDEHPDDPDFHLGPQGFQWGRPEWRVIGVFLLLAFAFAVFFFLFVFLCVLVLVAAGLRSALEQAQTPDAMLASLGPTGTAIVTAMSVGFLVAVIYVSIRVSLASAATVSRRRISVFDTWTLTKGQVLPILAATVMVSLPSLMAGLLAGLFVAALAPGEGEGAAQVALPLALAIGAIPGLVMAFVQLPLSVGLTAYLFRGLRPPEEAAKLKVFD